MKTRSASISFSSSSSSSIFMLQQEWGQEEEKRGRGRRRARARNKIDIVRFTMSILAAGMIEGCVSTPRTPADRPIPDPSDPAAPQASVKPFRPNLVATTKAYIDPSIGQDAQKMEHGNMQGMESMEGMDHSQMKDMGKRSDSKMQGMDHSQMPGMSSPPANKEVLEQEIKRPPMR